MTLETQPCMTCGLHHRSRDFAPICLLTLKARVSELEKELAEPGSRWKRYREQRDNYRKALESIAEDSCGGCDSVAIARAAINY